MAKELKIKGVNAECAELYIGEDEEYNIFLCRKLRGEPIQIMRMWRVEFHCPQTKAELKEGVGIVRRVMHALAPTPEEAEGQAQCVLEKDGHGDEKYITCYVERVPFVIRGWSGREF